MSARRKPASCPARPTDDDAGFDSRSGRGRSTSTSGSRTWSANLRVAIEAARSRGEALDHVLLFGPPGVGKTSLAHVMAAELRVAIKATAGPIIERAGDLAALLTALEHPRGAVHRRDPPPGGEGGGDPLPGARGLHAST